jgi:hypothetical protein
VGEQVPDPDGLGHGHGGGVLRRPGPVDAGVGEGRDPPRDRVGQLQHALLVEHHRGDGGDRFGHRVDAPDRVVGDREVGVEIAAAVVRQVHDAPVPRDDDRPAGQPTVVDVAAEVLVDPGQPVGVEPDLARLRVHLDLGHAGRPYPRTGARPRAQAEGLDCTSG